MFQYIIIPVIGLCYFLKNLKIKKPLIISVDGNIGSGKSTFVDILKEEFSNNKEILFLQEPVDEWLSVEDNEKNNILSNFYSDDVRWSYTFQNFAFITRTHMLKQLMDENTVSIFSKRKIIISERSTETDKNVFAKMLYDDKKISELEYKIYKYWYKMLYNNRIANIIYLRTSPSKSFERIQKRNRKEEETIEEDYIRKVHNYHDKWLCEHGNYRILLLDGNTEFEENTNLKKELVSQVHSFLNKLY